VAIAGNPFKEERLMQQLQQDIADFTSFVNAHSGESTSLDELYDRWREVYPAAEDGLAVQASLRDMERGETGRSFEEFAADFHKRNNA
jgi:hypothetical protein